MEKGDSARADAASAGSAWAVSKAAEAVSKAAEATNQAATAIPTTGGAADRANDGNDNTTDRGDGGAAPTPIPDGPLEVTVSSATVWRVVRIVLMTGALLWALNSARSFVSLVVISLFLALALLPAVNHLHERRGWRRGSAVGVIYLAGFVVVAMMIAVLIPSLARFGESIANDGGSWLERANEWTSSNLGFNLVSEQESAEAVDTAAQSLGDWLDGPFGTVVNAASTGIGFIFNLATVAMFTFYFTADFGRMRRWFLGFYPPTTQKRLGWTIDEAIRQTGGYFYSRMILMLICGAGFFLTMVAVGVPVALALGLAISAGFITEFIPAIGTYVGAALPVLATLALSGFVPALIVVVFAVVYQQIENYWLSPRLSAETMNLNGAVAFGSALFGGALFGPIGAFMALPTAALLTSFIENYTERYPVVDDSGFVDDDTDTDEDSATPPAR